MTAVTHARLAARRGSSGGTWWSKAFLRAVEEAAYAPADLRRGRSLARTASVGRITVDSGTAVAAVSEGDDTWSVTVTVPPLSGADLEEFVEVVASGAGHIGALMGGHLPHPFVEAVEEAGVELLPYGGEIGSACSCDAWLDPCPHALAVLTQLAWLVQADPFVLTHLRGLSREALLARLHARQVPTAGPGLGDAAAAADLDTALEAALRAARLLHAPADQSVVTGEG
jgi:uncharacterized Zn finger protein